MCGRPTGDELDPHERFLAGLKKVGALAVESHGVAADLADGLCRSGEELWVVVNEEVRAEHSPVLLVGEEGDNEIACRLAAALEDVAKGRDDHRVHVLHVHRPAAPEHSVADCSLEGVDCPIRRVGGYDIRMPVHDQRRLAGVRSGYACDDACAPGRGVDVLRRQTEPLEVRAEVFGRLRLAVGSALAVVRGVETDEVAGDRGSRLEFHGSTVPVVAGRAGEVLLSYLGAPHSTENQMRADGGNGRRASLRC